MSVDGKYYAHLIYFIMLWVMAELQQPSISASNPDILSDYYWGSSELRTQDTLTCDNEVLQIICINKCGKTYMCKNDRCICDDEDKHQKKKSTSRSQYDSQSYYYPYEDNKYLIHSNEYTDDVDLPQALDIPEDTEELKEGANETPVLRHHIAHFCPNLDEARKCIRSCTKLGKPAFCGKDHVCYCGHKYSSHDKEKPIDLEDTYAEFRDLYEKYFGPQDS